VCMLVNCDGSPALYSVPSIMQLFLDDDQRRWGSFSFRERGKKRSFHPSFMLNGDEYLQPAAELVI
jgi:hypothetical protein